MQSQSEPNSIVSSPLINDSKAEMEEGTMKEDDPMEGSLRVINKYFEATPQISCSGALRLNPGLWSPRKYMRINHAQLVDACKNNGADEELLRGTKAQLASWLVSKQIPYPENGDDKIEWSTSIKPLNPELAANMNADNNQNSNNNNSDDREDDFEDDSNNNNNNNTRYRNAGSNNSNKRPRQSVNYLECESSSSESEFNQDTPLQHLNQTQNKGKDEGVSNNSKNNNDTNYYTGKKHPKIHGSGGINNNNLSNSTSSSSSNGDRWFCYRCSFELKEGMLGCPYHGSIRRWDSLTNQWISDIPCNNRNSSNDNSSNQNWNVQPNMEDTGNNKNNNDNNMSSHGSGDRNQSTRNGRASTPHVAAPNNNGGTMSGTQVNNTGNTYFNNTFTDPHLTDLKSNCIVSTSTANHSLLNHTIVKRVLEGHFVPIENFKVVSSNKVFQGETEPDLSSGTFSFDPASGQFTKNPTRERAINIKKLNSIEEFCVAFLTGLMPIACGNNSERISDYNAFLSECLHAISILNNVEVGIEYCEEIRRRHQQNNSNNINNNSFNGNGRLASLGGLDMNIFQIVSTRNMLKLIQHSSKGNYGTKSPQSEYVRNPCFKFNGPNGCQDERCKFVHRCSEPKCESKHSRFSFHPESYQKDKDKWAEGKKSKSKSGKSKSSSNVKEESQE
jgi:hypothetical protein